MAGASVGQGLAPHARVPPGALALSEALIGLWPTVWGALGWTWGLPGSSRMRQDPALLGSFRCRAPGLQLVVSPSLEAGHGGLLSLGAAAPRCD